MLDLSLQRRHVRTKVDIVSSFAAENLRNKLSGDRLAKDRHFERDEPLHFRRSLNAGFRYPGNAQGKGATIGNGWNW